MTVRLEESWKGTKKKLKAYHLIWLAGPLLDGDYRMPAALRMQAPELVRGHFLEPFIAVKLIKDWPMFDPGLLCWK